MMALCPMVKRKYQVHTILKGYERTRSKDRNTAFLFAPSAQALRPDPRFRRLVAAIGLDRYWTQSGHRPDYQLTIS